MKIRIGLNITNKIKKSEIVTINKFHQSRDCHTKLKMSHES